MVAEESPFRSADAPEDKVRCHPSAPSDDSLLTELSNVVAYACRPWSTKDRHDVHRHRRLASRGTAGRRCYDVPALLAAFPWPRNERRKGRKGRKPRILRKQEPCRCRRDAAETGGNWRKLLQTGGHALEGTSRVAENAENKFYCADAALRLHRMRNIISCGRGEPASLTGDGQNG